MLDKFGPLVTLHTPVPITAVFAANVAVLVEQMFWFGPATDVVGAAVTSMVTLEADGAQGALLIVHVNT